MSETQFRHLCELVLRHQMRVPNYFVNSFYSEGFIAGVNDTEINNHSQISPQIFGKIRNGAYGLLRKPEVENLVSFSL